MESAGPPKPAARDPGETMVPPASSPTQAVVSTRPTEGDMGATVVPPAADDLSPAATHAPAPTSQQGAAPAGGKAPAARKPAADPRKITQLGDFKLVKKLGQGGMGEVYLALQVSLDRQVALKVMGKQFSSQEAFVQRFKREAQTMARLDHPNIVRGFAVGEDQGLLYLAMEFIKGRSMQNWMNDLGKLTVGDALHVTLKVAGALQHAHQLNLIHRDIKPDNVLVTDKGVVKLADMGLAKATDEDMSMTQSGTGLGTPYYMPPEQARNAKHVDHRSDIYALGGTLYYFLTGKLPFAGDSAMELILAKEKGGFTRARQQNSEIPERLDLMIDKMLAKDPKVRYQSCEEMIRDLSTLQLDNPALSFIEGADVAAPRMPKPAAAPAHSASTPRPASKPRPHTSAPEDHVWHVTLVTPDGKSRKVKMTTGQIKQQLKTGHIDHRAKCCATPDGTFLPLAAHRDFEQVVKERLIKAEAEKKSAQFDKLYADIDRQQSWHKWSKWIRGYTDGVKGLISLILYLAVLVAIGVGLWMYAPVVIAMIRSKVGG